MDDASRRYLGWVLIGLTVALGSSACSSSETPSGPEPTQDGGPDVSAEASTDVATEEAATDAASDADAPFVVEDVKDEALCGGQCIVSLCVDGGCVECTSNAHCGGGLPPRCDTSTHTCVECVSGPTDNCAKGKYCTAGMTCVPGCKSNGSCASGLCNAKHECEPCTDDTECSGGNVCGTGVCRPACTTAGQCGDAGLDCCGGHCVDTAADIGNCLGCGMACSAVQFCGTGGCAAVALSNVCANSKTTKLLNGQAADDASNAVIQNGLTSVCSPAPIASSASQEMPGIINPSTGQSVIGPGNLITATGGYIVEKLVKFLDSVGATPIQLVQGDIQWEYHTRIETGGGADASVLGPVVASIPYTQITDSHDLFLLEMARNPSTGTLVLIAFGQTYQGTAAAALYFASTVLPNRATYD